jgi:hypothetical protein
MTVAGKGLYVRRADSPARQKWARAALPEGFFCGLRHVFRRFFLCSVQAFLQSRKRLRESPALIWIVQHTSKFPSRVFVRPLEDHAQPNLDGIGRQAKILIGRERRLELQTELIDRHRSRRRIVGQHRLHTKKEKEKNTDVFHCPQH